MRRETYSITNLLDERNEFMPYEYSAVFTHQRSSSDPIMALFVAPAGEINKWAKVSRASHDGNGSQRLRNEGKVGAIKRFLEQNNRNTIPTALVISLHLSEDPEWETNECSKIIIPEDFDEPPGLIIDGQHRMFGVAAFDENLPLNVIALINPTDEEIAFQFLVINSKATKVPTDHVKFLALQYAQDALADRLKDARMALGRHTFVGIVDGLTESPFYRSVIWPTEESTSDADRHEVVLPAAIEQSLAAITKKNLPDLSNDDSLMDFFFTLWQSVKEQWPELWTADSQLLKKVGLVTFTTFVIEDIVPVADRGNVDLSDPDQVRHEITSNILNHLNPEFWKREWISKSLDTSSGRQMVVDEIRVMRRNLLRGASWDADLRLVADAEQEE